MGMKVQYHLDFEVQKHKFYFQLLNIFQQFLGSQNLLDKYFRYRIVLIYQLVLKKSFLKNWSKGVLLLKQWVYLGRERKKVIF